MGRRESRRVLLLTVAVAVTVALATAWLCRALHEPTLEERVREKAEELKGKVRELTR